MMAPIIFMTDITTLKWGKGGLHVIFHKCIQKYLIDLSVSNFNVTDSSFIKDCEDVIQLQSLTN